MAVYEPCHQYNTFTGIKSSGLQELYKNDSCIYNNTNSTRSYFIVCPQWLSEKIEGPPPNTSRGHRPWPFEYPGARLATPPETPEQQEMREREESEEREREAERERCRLPRIPRITLLTTSLPQWGSLSHSPRAWLAPAKYTYQLDNSRYETNGPTAHTSRLTADDVWLNPRESRNLQPAPTISPFPRYKDGPRPPTPPRFGRLNTTLY